MDNLIEAVKAPTVGLAEPAATEAPTASDVTADALAPPARPPASSSTATKKKKKKPPGSSSLSSDVARVDDDEAACNEKTGRWTEEEHTRFLQGLELFGKKWTKVADIVGTRTTVQVRSHAQKYFQKLEKDRAAPTSGGSGVDRPPAKATTSRPVAEPEGAKGTAQLSARTGGAGPVAVPVALRRFLPPKVVASGRAGATDLAAGLFNFLTPLALPETSEPKRPEDEEEEEDDDALKGAASPPDSVDKTGVPDWYRRGGKLKELLDEATTIDWREDDGGDRLTEATALDNTPCGGTSDVKHRPGERGPSTSAPAPSADEDATADRGSGPLPRYSSFDALCTASLVVATDAPSGHGGRKRTLSQGSDPLAFDEGLFYDDALYFDDPGPTPAI